MQLAHGVQYACPQSEIGRGISQRAGFVHLAVTADPNNDIEFCTRGTRAKGLIETSACCADEWREGLLKRALAQLPAGRLIWARQSVSANPGTVDLLGRLGRSCAVRQRSRKRYVCRRGEGREQTA